MAQIEFMPKGKIEQSGRSRQNRDRLITLEAEPGGGYSVRAYHVSSTELTTEPVDQKTAVEIFTKFTSRRGKL